MKKDIGQRLLEVLCKQRQFFIRTADGSKIVSNHLVYNSLEEKSIRIQEEIGRRNKRSIIAECKEKGLKIPNFRLEGLDKK